MCETEAETMAIGLALAGFTVRNQQSCINPTNNKRFKSAYGSKPIVVCQIWRDLRTSDIVDAFVGADCNIKMLFLALHFLKCYPTEGILAAMFKMSEKLVRHWVWFFVKKLTLTLNL
jgi:hypothetical protein